MESIYEVIKDKDTPAIFVVHGIGKQRKAETAAKLYGTFEDVIDSLKKDWVDSGKIGEFDEKVKNGKAQPFVFDGFWSNYDEAEAAMTKKWEHLTPWEKHFMEEMWSERVVSAGETYRWFLKQTFRLAGLFRNFKHRGIGAFISIPLYFLLIPVSFIVLTFAYLKKNEILKDYLNDVRLYVDPKGKLEKEVVASINARVKKQYLQLIGLDESFIELPNEKLIKLDSVPRKFDRVVWLSHSLGTVISYNVMSELLVEADKHLVNNKEHSGAKLFKKSLARFVTIGSPLDKIAFLFPKALNPWPNISRDKLLPNGDRKKGWILKYKTEWWINIYHLLDPVSGSLDSKLICKKNPPANFHAGLRQLPGVAHAGYWKDMFTLRYVVSRTFGESRVPYFKHVPYPSWFLAWGAVLANLMWLVLCLVVVGLFVGWIGGEITSVWDWLCNAWAWIGDKCVWLFGGRG